MVGAWQRPHTASRAPAWPIDCTECAMACRDASHEPCDAGARYRQPFQPVFALLTGRPAPPAKIRAKRPPTSAWHAQNPSQRHLTPSQNSARQNALLQSAAAMARVVRFFRGFSSSNRVLTHSVPPGFSEAKCFNCHDLRVHNSLYFLMNGRLRNFCY